MDGSRGMFGAAVLAGVLFCGQTMAQDGGADGIVRSGAHMALIAQVKLLRTEVKKTRSYFEGEHIRRLKQDLASAEQVLASVEQLYGARLAGCQAPYLRMAQANPGQLPAPAYFACTQVPQVDDQSVSDIRRQQEIQRRLAASGLGTHKRDSLQAELRDIQRRLTAAGGVEPLDIQDLPHVEPWTAGPDGGP